VSVPTFDLPYTGKGHRAGFMSGFTMFIPAVNVIVIISHTLGCIYTCIFIMEACTEPSETRADRRTPPPLRLTSPRLRQAWHYLTAWYITVFFAGPVALLELCIILGSFCLGGLNRA
jgi:hypothetical protein